MNFVLLCYFNFITFIFLQDGIPSHQNEVGAGGVGQKMSSPLRGSWTSGALVSSSKTSNDISYLERYIARSKMVPAKDAMIQLPNYDRTDSQGSYFEMYKNKMKKLKAAGLQADAAIINSMSPGVGGRQFSSNSQSLTYKKGSLMRAHHLPVEMLGGAGAGTRSLSPVPNGHLSPLSPGADTNRLSNSWSGGDKNDMIDFPMPVSGNYAMFS